MVFTESSKIGHVDCETGEEADDYVEGLQGRPYAADFGVDIRGAVDEGTSTMGDDNGLEGASDNKVELKLDACIYPKEKCASIYLSGFCS